MGDLGIYRAEQIVDNCEFLPWVFFTLVEGFARRCRSSGGARINHWRLQKVHPKRYSRNSSVQFRTRGPHGPIHMQMRGSRLTPKQDPNLRGQDKKSFRRLRTWLQASRKWVRDNDSHVPFLKERRRHAKKAESVSPQRAAASTSTVLIF